MKGKAILFTIISVLWTGTFLSASGQKRNIPLREWSRIQERPGSKVAEEKIISLAEAVRQHHQGRFSPPDLSGEGENTEFFAFSVEGQAGTLKMDPTLSDTEVIVLDSLVGYKLSDRDSTRSVVTVFYYDLHTWLTKKITRIYDDQNMDWENKEKWEYGYNENGKIIREAKYLWDEDNAGWKVCDLSNYAYDENDRMIMKEKYLWDDFSNTLFGAYKWESVSDDNGASKALVYYQWDYDKNEWRFDYKWENVLSDTSSVNIYYEWSVDDQQWVDSIKYENVYGKYYNTYYYQDAIADWFLTKHEIYYYNDTGDTLRESLILARSWPDTLWHNDSRVLHTYEGLREVDTIYSWDDTDADWKYAEIDEYVHDEEGRCLSSMYYAWDTNTSSWFLFFGCERTYNNAGKRTSFTGWSKSGIVLQRKYYYDEQNRMIAEEFGPGPILTSRKEYGYDSDDRKIYQISFSWDENEGWVAYMKYWYYYGLFSGIDELKKGHWKVYPNPAGEVIYINTGTNITPPTEVVIINLNGQIVLQKDLGSDIYEVGIPVEGLRSGMYIMRLYTDDELMYTTKVIIQH